MSKDTLFLRGSRILQQLDETTYQQLKQNTLQFQPPTSKRQHAVDPIQVVGLELTPFVPSKVLNTEGRVKSGGKDYQSLISFLDVVYENDDEPNNVSFVASNGETYHIKPIILSQHNVKVRCTCLDFRWRFSLWNKRDGSLYGRGPGPYVKKTDRPPVNQKQVPGVCKHLMKLVLALNDAGLTKG